MNDISIIDKPLTRDDIARLMLYLNQLWLDYTRCNDKKIDKLIEIIELQNERYNNEIHNIINAISSEQPIKLYSSRALVETPPEVKSCITKIAKKRRINYMKAAQDTYKEIERRTGCNLTKEVAKFAAQHGYKNCRKSYYIGNTKRYFDVLEEIANE